VPAPSPCYGPVESMGWIHEFSEEGQPGQVVGEELGGKDTEVPIVGLGQLRHITVPILTLSCMDLIA